MSEFEMAPRPVELMIIEDNDGDVLLIREALRSSKVEINLNVAGDGEMALRMLNRQPPYADQPMPDLILLDLNLPRKDGREVLYEIKSNPVTTRIPVIILTSSRSEIDVVTSYAFNANGYVEKPAQFSEMKKMMESLSEFWFRVALLPSVSNFARRHEC